MKTKATETAPTGTARLAAELIEKAAALTQAGARDALKALRLAAYTTQGLLDASLIAPIGAMIDMNQIVTTSFLSALKGEREAGEVLRETASRFVAGASLPFLVARFGKELFGSATFPGEKVLAEDRYLKLTHIPPADGAAPAPVALFHAGGGIPYGDRIFRMLPEANLFDRFRERGVPVYAMELRGDRREVDYSGLTLEGLIESIEQMSGVAFEHGGRRKMVLEGYCGHGMQALAYAAAKPRDADGKFLAACLFVAPVDGTQCAQIGELAQITPEPALAGNLSLFEMTTGYVPADSMRTGLDLALKTLFLRSPLGAFVAGFRQPGYARVERIEDLGPAERKELAGAYWLSRENAGRFALPVDLARFATALFTRGISQRGEIPASYKGMPLSLRDIAEQTRLRLVGIFGGRDVVVPDRTAFALMPIFGERYRHVVHPEAGHISYILTPAIWERSAPGALVPNPIDLILEAASGATA